MSISKLSAAVVLVIGLLVASQAVAASFECPTGDCVVALGTLECPGVGCSSADIPCSGNCLAPHPCHVSQCQLAREADRLGGNCWRPVVVDDCVGSCCIHQLP
jgi:hypothetical protein